MTYPKTDAVGACKSAPTNREIEKAQGSYLENYSNDEDANLTGFSEADRKRVGSLLASFGASSMGEGDPVSGGNLLAAMACSVANIEHAGSGLIDLEGSILEVGTSLGVSGSHSSALIEEQVFRPLEQRQYNLNAHLGIYETWKNENEAKDSLFREEDTTDIAEYLVDDVVRDVFNHVSLDGELYPEQCLRLIRPASSGFHRGLLKQSLVFMTAGSHEQLTQNLERSHSGYLFVRIGVNHGSDGVKLADVLNNYDNRCGVTGLPVRELLVASHILPWSNHETERLNVRNGICLNRLHDAAFDQGLISFDNELRLMLSPKLRSRLPQQAVGYHFEAFERRKLELPDDAQPPDQTFLSKHRMRFELV